MNIKRDEFSFLSLLKVYVEQQRSDSKIETKIRRMSRVSTVILLESVLLFTTHANKGKRKGYRVEHKERESAVVFSTIVNYLIVYHIRVLCSV